MPAPQTSWRWCLVALAFVETLTASGIMFGWSAASLALQREGVYAELCHNSSSAGAVCEAQVLRLNAVYGSAATAMPISMFVWGPAMDRIGVRRTRVTSLLIFIGGALLFALAGYDASSSVDAYTVAAVMISTGGGGFFLSHFIVAEHFRGTHFGLVHTLLNGAFDSSTVTMVALEGANSAGLSLRGCFLSLAGLGCVYLALTSDRVWRGLLSPPRYPSVRSLEPVSVTDPEVPPTDTAGMPMQYGKAMDLSQLTLAQQFCSPHFAAVALWALLAIFRTMFVLGTIGVQLQYNGGGRDSARVEHFVRVFNWLILLSAPIGPAFGWLLDRYGTAACFIVVNLLGAVADLGLGLGRAEAVLCVAFVCFGCFRAFNYATMTAYVQGVFGHASFGTLYGVGVGSVAAVCGFAQSPMTAWAIRNVNAGEWESLGSLNVGIVLVSLLLFGFPTWILWVGRSQPPKPLPSVPAASQLQLAAAAAAAGGRDRL